MLVEETFIGSNSLEDLGSEASLSPDLGLFGRGPLGMSNPVQIPNLKTVTGGPPSYEPDVRITLQGSLGSVSFEMNELRESARLAFLIAGWTAVFVVIVKIKPTAAVTANRSVRRYPSVC